MTAKVTNTGVYLVIGSYTPMYNKRFTGRSMKDNPCKNILVNNNDVEFITSDRYSRTRLVLVSVAASRLAPSVYAPLRFAPSR